MKEKYSHLLKASRQGSTVCFSMIIGLVLLGATYVNAQHVVSINPIKDNTLYESAAGDLSNGAGIHFFAGKTGQGSIRRGLVAFDIADNVPDNAEVDSVFVQLHMSKTVAGATPVSLSRVLMNWGEGASDAGANEGAGTQAQPGDATWTYAFYDTTLWNTPGGDFQATASATASVADTGFYTWESTPELIDDVQRWIDLPGENFGWIVRGDESANSTAKRFDTRENSTEAFRPLLTVYYRVPVSINEQSPVVSSNFKLEQNYPNPFNPVTHIPFSLKTPADVRIEIVDVNGRRIKILADHNFAAGTHTLTWNGDDENGRVVGSGIYFYRLTADGVSLSRRLLLMK